MSSGILPAGVTTAIMFATVGEKVMNPKPGDLLLGILEFFGILIPGAFAVFLLYLVLLALAPYCPAWNAYFPGWSSGTNLDWALTFFVSIVLGHFLHGLSDRIDRRIGIRYLSDKAKAYLEAAQTCNLVYPPEQFGLANVRTTAMEYFFVAFAYIRVRDAAALAELERHAADYKLFRSLTLLALVSSVFLFVVTGSGILFVLTGLGLSRLFPEPAGTPWSIEIEAVLFVVSVGCTALSLCRYRQLFNDTYVLAFELYIQVCGKSCKSKNPNSP